MLMRMIETKIMVKVKENSNKRNESNQANLEGKLFNCLMNNDEIPFGNNFSGMRTLRKVLDDNIELIFDKIETVSNKHEEG